MLNVKTPDEVIKLIKNRFALRRTAAENIAVADALGRVLFKDIVSGEDVPGFDRSTVDGYAVIASCTFGCSDSLPAVLTFKGEVKMGESAGFSLSPGTCAVVSTGGELPENANAVVMVEHTEDYGSGMIGISKPAAPGNNLIFKGDDISAGELVLAAGTKLTAHGTGILSALGYCEAAVCCKPLAGIISTGDELVEPSGKPAGGQIRDVNSSMLHAAMVSFGADVRNYGIIRDVEASIASAVREAAAACDIVLISGGSSAGTRDLTARVLEAEGELLLHGIAMKPGKPTILGVIDDTPVFGLPGHPVAAFFVAELFVRPLIAELTGSTVKRFTTGAVTSEALSSNHGRAEFIAVRLNDTGTAFPVRGKSGLIASLAGVDGYICVPRDCEGLPKGAEVVVTYF